ncbi:chemotaxis protein-glutamate methyltransferase CheR, partial [Candidatus Magnetobacterium bavaricum]
MMVWSAGCSTGEEPYTLAMVLSDFSEKNGLDFMIIATDISTKVLDKAKSGIYEEERVIPVSTQMKKKYLLRSKDKSKGLVRIVPELRELIRFRRLNFMDSDFGFRETMDVIFCRNVVIYFDKKTQERLLNQFARYLARGGYLFMGHSET